MEMKKGKKMYFFYLARVSEGVSSRGCVNPVELTGNSVAGRLRMPQWFSADGHAQPGYTDLSDLDDDRSVRSLRRMVARADRMVRVGLMSVVNVVVRIVQIVVRIVQAVMRVVNIVMRSVKAVM